jgi:histidinol-phosphate aminotransferase
MLPKHTSLIESLAPTTPFVGPEALERRTGKAIELRLGANESPFGASPTAVAAMARQAAETQNYGDPEGFLVRQEVARQLEVPIETIVLGAGIDELLGLCCRVFIEPGQIVVTTSGSYPTFDYGAAACGAKFHRIPYLNEKADLAGLAQAAHETGARIVYLANPDNPSGSWHSPADLAQFREMLPLGCVLLLDEAYVEFAPSAPAISPEDVQVIRLRTFSKAHGMAGIRIAYVVAHPEHALGLNKIRNHFAVNCVAQAGALASLADAGHVASVVASTTSGRDEIVEFMCALGLRPLPSFTNFVTVDVGSKARGEAILEALLQRGVFIRKPGLPPLDRCIRVTIGRPEQRRQFAETFEAVLREV